MHLKKQKRKDGRIYLSIEESFRVGGKTKSRHVRSIGYVDELISDDMRDPIAWWEDYVHQQNAEAKAAQAPHLVKFFKEKKIDKKEVAGQIDLGAAVFSSYFYRDLKIWEFFERKRTARSFKYDPSRILELLVWNRIAEPASKKKAWKRRNRYPRSCKFGLADVYRSLDYLAKNSDALVAHMNRSFEEVHGKRNKTRLYYDVTNYYFELDGEDEVGLRKKGVSKEHRPEPIVQMGLLLDGDGFPFNFELFAGNTTDMSTMVPIMNKAKISHKEKDKECERVIMVADKGLNTSANIARIILDGNGFIISQSVRKASQTLISWVTDETGYISNSSESFKIKSRLAQKAVYVKDTQGKKHKVMVPVKVVAFWSKDYFERARHEREKVIEKSLAALKRNDVAAALARSSAKYTKDIPVVKETGELAEHVWVLDEEKIAADAAVDGYYCIITSEQDMDERSIIEAYRGLWRIEESFRVMKSDFSTRPVYVSTEAHIRAHFLICYIALFIMRLMQSDTGWNYSAASIAEALRGVVGHRMDTNVYYFDYRTDLTDELAELVGIDLSKQVLTKQDIRNILASVRKPKD